MTDVGYFNFRRLILVFLLCMASAATAQEEPDLEDAMRHEDSGESRKALSIYNQIAKDTTETEFFRFYAFLGCGRIMAAEGNYWGAFDAYEEGIALADRIGPDFTDGQNARFNLANLYTQFGKYDDAEKLLASTQWKPSSDGSRKSATLLAEIAARRGDNGRALAILDSIAPEFEGDNFNRAVMLQNRGYILRDLNRTDAAVEDFKEAVALLSGKGKYVAVSNLAMAQADLGIFDEAVSNIDSAIKYFRSLAGKDDGDLAIALRKKGEILAKAGRRMEASKAFKEFFDLDKKDIIGKLPEMSPSTRLDYWTKEKPSLSKVFLLGDLDVDFLADVSLFRHQTSLMGMNDVEQLAKNLSLDTKGVRKNLPEKGVALQLIEYEAAPGIVEYAGILTPKQGKSKFIPLFNKSIIHDEDLLYPYSLYSAVTEENPVALNRLYTDNAMAEKVWKPILSHLAADVSDIYFTPEGIFHLWGIENMAYEPLKSYNINRLSSMAALSGAHKNLAGSGKALVIGGLDYSDSNPLESESNEGCASGEYGNNVSEDTSPDRSASAILLEYAILPEGMEIFRELPMTRPEAERVASLVHGADKRFVLSEETLKREIGNFQTVHIATHGYCLDSGIHQRPQMLSDSIVVDNSLLYSGLALTGANHCDRLQGEDGILSAREICNLDLSKADIIVLSACQTAKGMITDEGVSGLIRALKMAGAGSIIASLWEVNDASTCVFMEEFYRHLSQGQSKREAFEAARKHLLTFKKTVSHKKFSASSMSGSKKSITKEIAPYADPIYNAPFILID